MIQRFTRLVIADNTGGKVGMCIGIPGASYKKYATIGDIITIVVKSAIPQSEIKEASIHHAVVIRTKKEYRRKTGTYIRFDENACVLITKEKEPVGTRVFGPVPRELREKNFTKIASLAPEVV